MASERTTQTQTVQQAATNSDGEAPWTDLEVAIPNDRDHASLVSLVECALIELTHEHVGAVVVTHQVRGRTARSTSPSTTSASSSRSGTSTSGWAGTGPPFLERPFATNSSPSSPGRQPHKRNSHEKQQPASGHVHREAGSGTPDFIAYTLNQHSGSAPGTVLVNDVARIHALNPRPPPCSSTTLPLSAIAIRDRTDTAGCSCLSAPQAVQRATMSAA